MSTLKKNNLWARQVLEKYLGVDLNSSKSSLSWGLKVVSLKHLKNGNLTVPRAMFITTVGAHYLKQTDFENSCLYSKLEKIIIAARIWESQREERSILHSITTFDLDDPEVYRQIKADYDLARETIQTQGFSAVTGKMGIYVQPKTIVSGRGIDSIAFYVRTNLLKKMILQGTDVPS